MNNILFIRVNEQGTVEHPILEENVREFYPDLDVNNPPEGFARFERVEAPLFDDFRVVDKTKYVLSEELTQQYGTPTYTDLHIIREMTDEEKTEKLNFIQSNNIPSDTPVVNIPNPIIETQALDIPPKPDGDYIWNPYCNSWVDRQQLKDIFFDFFTRNGLSFESFDIRNLTEEQKTEFTDLIEESKKIL